jgi:uncharacterized protein
MQMQLKLLWELQEFDLAISNIRQQLEERPWLCGVGELRERLDELKNSYSQLDETLKEDRKTLRALEMKTQKIVDDRKKLYDKMYDGKTTAKELEQMLQKMDLLAAEKLKTEDAALLLMESVEEQDMALLTVVGEMATCERELSEKETALAIELDNLNSELRSVQAERESLVAQVEPKYLNKYNVLFDKFQGRPMAKVTGELCGGCRVFISSGLKGHLYNPGAMVYCENCGRLMVKLEDQ